MLPLRTASAVAASNTAAVTCAARFASGNATPLPPKTKIHNVSSSNDKKKLEIKFENGTTGSFPFVWLRDCAPSNNKPCHLNELSLSIKPEKMELNKTGDEVVIQWPPYRMATYSSEWLMSHMDSEDSALEPIRSSARIWSGSDIGRIPEISNALENESENLRKAFSEYGIVKIKAGHNIAEGDVVTCLGKNGECVGQSEKHLTRAYPISTQHPEASPVPFIVTIKALRAGKGVFHAVDGFHIATEFQADHPELFEFIASNPVSYQQSRHPIFRLNNVGTLETVIFNNDVRESMDLQPRRKYELYYKGLKVFNEECYKKGNYAEIELSEGDILVIDNTRVLTGNSPFAPVSSAAQKPVYRLSSFKLK